MLSILEYDEEWEKKKLRQTEYEAGKEDGIAQGKQKKLITLVCKKLKRGCSIEEIAEILEEDIETIRPICEVAQVYAPDYEIEKIWSAYCKQSS